MCAREESLKKGTLQIGQMEEWLAEKIIDEVASINPKTLLGRISDKSPDN